jgi:CTP:molybdopterin cytidylyltransferase MocA
VTTAPAAVILAAGKGGRIGQPKHRLQTGGETFLDVIVRLAQNAGCSPVVCVVAQEEAEQIRGGINEGLIVVVNPDPARGMLSSLREAMPHVQDAPGMFVFPVDHPYITARTVDILVKMAIVQPDDVVKPEYVGRGGHPVYVPAGLFAMIRRAGGDASLRTIISDSQVRVLRILVDDEGVVHNVNTPGDLR